MLVLMVETDYQSIEKEMILHWFRFAFIVIFLVECILKIIAFRKHYFKDGWNILDFVVLILTIVGTFSRGDVSVMMSLLLLIATFIHFLSEN